MADVVEALNVRVVGTGSRYVVLAHGFGSDQSAWRRVLPYLTEDYRVVLFDLVCSGSVNPDYFDFSRHTMLDGYVDDLLLVLDSVGVTCCSYVGHSISALIGILAAIRRPSLFSKLVLMGACPRFLRNEEYEGGFEVEDVQILLAAMESNYHAWAHGFPPLTVAADMPEAVVEFSRPLFNMRPDISLFVCQTVFECDFRGVLEMVRTRCVIIHTARDNFIPISVVTYMCDHLGGRTTVIILYTEGHLPHISVPAMTATALTRALRAL